LSARAEAYVVRAGFASFGDKICPSFALGAGLGAIGSAGFGVRDCPPASRGVNSHRTAIPGQAAGRRGKLVR